MPESVIKLLVILVALAAGIASNYVEPSLSKLFVGVAIGLITNLFPSLAELGKKKDPPSSGGSSRLPGIGSASLGVMIMTAAVAAACASSSKIVPCSENDAVMAAKVAECKVLVKAKCDGLKGEECPERKSCYEWLESRCGVKEE